MERETDSTSPSGASIENVGCLDLTGLKSPEDVSRITGIRNVGCVVVRESLAASLAAIPMHNVGAVIPVPDDLTPRVLMGQTSLTGEALATGSSEDVLVILGQALITSPVKEVGYGKLVVAGQVFAPVGSEAAIVAAASSLSGQLLYYPFTEGARVLVQMGNIELGAGAVKNEGGDPGDVLACLGNLVLPEPVERLGYARLIVMGNLVAPRASEALLGPRTSVAGNVVYYDGKPRIFPGKDQLSNDFFELLDESVTLVVIGIVTFGPDVSREVVRQKVSSIVLIGKVVASQHLIPLLQMLATQKVGLFVPFEDGSTGNGD